MAPTSTPSHPDPAWVIVATVLRLGLVVGGVLLAVGVLLGIIMGDASTPALRLTDLFGGASLHARLEMGGIATFAITPAAGVLALVVTRIRERDWASTAIAIVVAAILAVGMVLGHA
jgi:uncharacterized membrane protein